MTSSTGSNSLASLMERLPILSRAAIAWAQQAEREGLAAGKPLAFWQQADARDVGVREPDKVRLCLVDTMPPIADPALAAVAGEMGFLGRDTLGLALGHAVFIRREHAGRRAMLRHELRHVAQCEVAGGLKQFLPEYLRQVLSFGYRQGPYEADARNYEIRKLTGDPK